MTIIFFTLLGLVLQGQPASIEGRVTRSGSNEPVIHAGVLLTKVGGQLSESLVAVADERGRFSIPNIPAGTYRLFAEHEDYVKAEFGQRDIGRPGSSITLAPGENLADLPLSLTKTGVISGRVSDRSGEPARARVQAMRRTYAEGKAVLTVVAETSTNDLGEYRLYGLIPGDYLVGATLYGYQRIQSGTYFGLNPLRIDALISIADAPRDLINVTTGGEFIEADAIHGGMNSTRYFPGASDPAGAQTIHVQPGAFIAMRDMQILPTARARTSSVSVRGQVIDGASGQPANTASVQLGNPERPFAMDTLFRSVRTSPESRAEFVIDHVDPGKYVILASNPTAMSGLMTLDIGNTDIDGVRLVLNPRITVSGRISIDGDRGKVDFTKMTLMLQGSVSSRQITPKADGTFSAPNIWPGNYRIVLIGAFSNVFLKAARVGTADVLSGGLSLSAPPEPLELLLSTSTGTLEGAVFERDQSPATAVRVVLVPDPVRRTHFEDYRATATDSLGRFRIEGIPPGEYTVFAWESLEDNAWQIPEILRSYEDKGKVVRIGERGNQTINLQMIPQTSAGNGWDH